MTGERIYYDYKIVQADDGIWEVHDPAGVLLAVFDDPASAGHYARVRILNEIEKGPRQ